jgi:hypothetical protein
VEGLQDISRIAGNESRRIENIFFIPFMLGGSNLAIKNGCPEQEGQPFKRSQK